MPNPSLVSQALYTVPALAEHLQALGFVPGPVGYNRLRDTYARNNGLLNETPNVRTVQKLFRGELIKYSTCDGIIRLLNIARHQQQLDLIDQKEIEEHEYYIAGFASTLSRIARSRQCKRADLIAAISQASGRDSKLIKALMKQYRTTEGRCAAVASAVLDLYGVTLEVSNAPVLARPRRTARVPKSVPKKAR